MFHQQCQDLLRLFEGHAKNHGVYKYNGKISADGKREGNGHTVVGGPNNKLWESHLQGKQGLGIVPINEQNNAKFGAIDIDIYDLDHKKVIKKVNDNQMPLVPVRSKSGGLHLFIFLVDWCPAGILIQKLTEMAAFLGHGGSEIFPKQDQLTERGCGNWINMPYFNADVSERFAYNPQFMRMTLKDFVKFAYSMQVTTETLLGLQYGVKQDLLPDGPPCLNYLVTGGFPAGTRNVGLFNLGVYAKKKNLDEWEKLTREYADKFLKPPLTTVEINGIIGSLRKSKEYTYQCKKPPLCNHCDPMKCRAKKYGIGLVGTGMPKLGSLTKLTSSPPIWIFDVEGGGRLELLADQLCNQSKYQVIVMEQCNHVFQPLKKDVWNAYLSRLFENVIIQEVPPELSPAGMLRHYFFEFLTSKIQALISMDQIITGKIWTYNGMHYFRFIDFENYLKRRKFTEVPRAKIHVLIKEWGAVSDKITINRRTVNIYKFPEIEKPDEPLETPPQLKQEQPI